ncbi:hypothetical protein LEP1GSC062_0308 [Leptospira alexanderi serovar Manhao 3 str. L 60]|uniref:Uncharacterized protein n=1 Tax=Leptospira alexanderi serovar Manhao 3 str. L 60 TaxID=1049759 RepID=V6HS98_9LEPT|nr:hypothetical protein LEP1GSC062_0308 [Leptospira alexanderi serovar Manhao 3 str. L 60]
MRGVEPNFRIAKVLQDSLFSTCVGLNQVDHLLFRPFLAYSPHAWG